MEDYAGFVRDVKTGAILGISNRNAFIQIEMDNSKLIKRKLSRLITHEVLSEAEGLKAYIEHYNRVNNIVIPEPIKARPGRKPNKK